MHKIFIFLTFSLFTSFGFAEEKICVLKGYKDASEIDQSMKEQNCVKGDLVMVHQDFGGGTQLNLTAHVCQLSNPTLQSVPYNNFLHCKYLGYQKKVCGIPSGTRDTDLDAILKKQSCKKGDRLILNHFRNKNSRKIALLCDHGELLRFLSPRKTICDYIGYVRKSEFSED
ncbi:MAG: hypothetical protein ACJ0Q2_04390 [Candidatus Azotimanducaceae bacterium]